MLIAGIGTREPSQLIIDRASELQEFSLFHKFVTGGAIGMDDIFSKIFNAKIMLPWDSYNEIYANNDTIIDCQKLSYKLRKEAELIASQMHEGWHNCKQGARTLHSRNVFIILGPDLQTPVNMVIYGTNDKDTTRLSGGTRMGVQLARSLGIPNFGLQFDDEFRNLKFLLEKLSEKRP